jgi:hypothetical protein
LLRRLVGDSYSEFEGPVVGGHGEGVLSIPVVNTGAEADVEKPKIEAVKIFELKAGFV